MIISSFFPMRRMDSSNWRQAQRSRAAYNYSDADEAADGAARAAARLTVKETADTIAHKKRSNLDALLGTIASYAPNGLYKTIVTEADSLDWIRIKDAFNLNANGHHFLNALDIQYKPGESYDLFFLRLRAFYQNSLMKTGEEFMAKILCKDDQLNPLSENLIVKEWLSLPQSLSLRPLYRPQLSLEEKGLLHRDDGEIGDQVPGAVAGSVGRSEHGRSEGGRRGGGHVRRCQPMFWQSLVFIFRLTSGITILHTGEFRASPEMESEAIFWNGRIDKIYLDTTYCR